MTINWMRRIDYWGGIPFCFVFSVFNKITRKISGRRKGSDKIKKILFLEFSEMGSAILSYPAMRKAKELYPDSELYFWIFESNQEAVHALGIVPKQNVITMRCGNILVLLIDIIRNLVKIHKEKIDVIIDMELFSRFSGMMTYLTGVPVRIGFNNYSQEGLYRGDLLTRKVFYNPYIHIAENFYSLALALQSSPDNAPCVKENLDANPTDLMLPKLKSDNRRREQIWNKLSKAEAAVDENSKIVVIHPSVNEALPLRGWDFNNYLELVEALLVDPDVFVVLVGTLFESLGETISMKLKLPRVINFIGKTDIQELIHLFNVSRILISHDSGIIHIASLTNIDIIVLFGPETPILYEPLTADKTILYKKFSCSPCLSAYNQRSSVCSDNKCMQAISPQEVHKAALEKISLSNHSFC